MNKSRPGLPGNSASSQQKISVSICVAAYNEEANIGRLLDALDRQKLSSCVIKEIIVVASGCTDRTEEIVREKKKKNRKIKLLSQAERKGKASAINLFLSHAQSEVLVLESGDTVPAQRTVESLVHPFTDSQIGMTGAHPLPVDGLSTFMGFCANFLWNMHHLLALRSPKLGEMVAFRNVLQKIPDDTAVDEACIEAIITAQGYKIQYIPDAPVYNKGPDTVSDFLKQRRRIANGHYHLKVTEKYTTSTMSPNLILNVLGRNIQLHLHRMKRLIRRGRYSLLACYLYGHLRRGVWIVGIISLEIIGRLLGWYDYYFKQKNPVVWDIASTTKNPSRK